MLISFPGTLGNISGNITELIFGNMEILEITFREQGNSQLFTDHSTSWDSLFTGALHAATVLSKSFRKSFFVCHLTQKK